MPPAVLEFSGDDVFADRALSALFHAAPLTTLPVTHSYRTERTHDGYLAVAPGRPPFGPAHLAEAFAFLEWRSVEDLLGLGEGIAFIHAAGVRIGEANVLLTGESGRGKSTVAAHLLSRGHLVWGDDLVRFAPEDGPYSGVPRSFKLDYKSLSGLPLVERRCMEGVFGTLLAPSWGYVSPAAIRQDWEAPSGKPSLLVNLEWAGPGEQTKLARTSEGLAAIAVIESLIGARSRGPEQRRRLTVDVMDSLTDVTAMTARSSSPQALALLLEREFLG